MNRGYDGNDIFAGNKNKAQFLEFLEGTAKKMKIHLLAYCILDNHYHLVLENNNGRMSDFLGQLNGLYGMYYRKIEGGKGYVFQSRFKSTLIDGEIWGQARQTPCFFITDSFLFFKPGKILKNLFFG